MNLTLYYSVINCGDGSAYPEFMESEELTEWDQDPNHGYSDGWAECCNGSIVVESDSEITCSEITTKEAYLIEKYFDDYDLERKSIERKEFIKKFFLNGLPLFKVRTSKSSNKEYLYNHIYVDGVEHGKVLKKIKESGQVFEEFLNSIGKIITEDRT